MVAQSIFLVALLSWLGMCDIIPPLTSSFGSYPNPLQLTEDDRRQFHPVVKFPRTENVEVKDFTTPPPKEEQLATEEKRQERRLQRQRARWYEWLGPFWRCRQRRCLQQRKSSRRFAIGRYDEDRKGLYTSDLFQQQERPRTLHIGLDLAGPLYTPVYAFADGIVHAAGYNEALGDYGNVVILQHTLPPLSNTTRTTTIADKPPVGQEERVVYALYGHLDHGSLRRCKQGQVVRRGQMIGRMGDISENGGWKLPHVHFQLSLHPPPTHDLPGAVHTDDRSQALVDYPDPRYVLGELY